MQMSSESRSRIKPPRLHLRYDVRRLLTNDAETKVTPEPSTSRFAVRYLNSTGVQGQFKNALNVCMGVFVSLGLLCSIIQSIKWKVRIPLHNTLFCMVV
jgi:hypothetical protein